MALSGPLISHASPSPSLLLDWLAKRDIAPYPSLDIVRMPNDGGLAIQANSDIPVGTVLMTIPKALIFSHRTASLSQHISPPEFGSPADAILYLTVCLLHELRLGEESELYGWMQILPREGVMLPTFWGEEELCGEDGRKGLEWLKGTEGGRELDRKDKEGLAYSDLLEYYNLVNPHLPLTTSNPSPSPMTHFLHAFSMISTRGFVIDDYHTIGLLPFCDLFNHSTKASHTSLLADAGVCPVCGSLQGCKHDADTGREAHMKEGEADEGVVDMRVERGVKQGEEVMSCYEEGVNDGKLLVEWGFASGAPGILSWGFREMLNAKSGRLFLEIRERGIVCQWNGEKSQSPEECLVVKEGDGSLGMRVDPAGSASVGLVLGVYLNLLVGDVNDISSYLRTIKSIESGFVNLLDRLIDPLEQPSIRNALALPTVRGVMSLFDERQRGIKLGDLDDTYQELKRQAPDSPLQLMAVKLVMGEKRVLQVAKQKWEALAQKFA